MLTHMPVTEIRKNTFIHIGGGGFPADNGWTEGWHLEANNYTHSHHGQFKIPKIPVYLWQEAKVPQFYSLI